jgi:hypothetical protein
MGIEFLKERGFEPPGAPLGSIGMIERDERGYDMSADIADAIGSSKEDATRPISRGENPSTKDSPVPAE